MKGLWSKLFVVAVAFTLLAGCVPIPAALPTPVPPTPSPIDLAYAFADRFNARDTEGLLALFTERPSYQVWSEANGEESIRWEIAFQTEIHGTMEVSDCQTDGGRLKCTIAARDVCIPPEIGALPFKSTFTFKDGKIQSVSSLVDPNVKSVYHQYDLERWPWMEKNMPEDYAAFQSWGSNNLTATEMGQVIYRLCTGYEAGKQ
jgi:hypothetical protein